MDDRYLTRHEVEKLTGYSRTGIYRLMNEGNFPLALKFGNPGQQGAVR